MLTRLIQFSLSQRLLVCLVVLILMGAGWRAFQDTPIDAFPDVSTTQVKIIIKAPGMTPEEIATRITSLVEVEMLGIPRQTMMRSIAKYGLTDITVDFAEGTDIYWARQQVAERLNTAWDNLPEGIEGGMAPMTTPLGEMFMFTVEGEGLTLAQRRELLDWTIRPALRSVPGVAEVNSLGGFVTTFEVVPDPARMTAHGIGLDTLQAAISANNRNDGAGRLDAGEETLLVRSEGAIRTLDDLAAIVVVPDPQQPLRVGDVADVHLAALSRYGAVTRNGEGETVQGLVLGLRGANAQAVVEGVKAELAALESVLPEGVRIEPFYDRSMLVNRAVHTVTKALIEATVLVLILLVLFLGNLRAALTVALILPLAAMGTFVLMRQFGLSANLMSLGGLAIAIGMLVDAAVVVVENVVTRLSHGAGGRLPRLNLIYRATREVAVPMVSGILIIIIVFLPLLTLQGLEGKLFKPVALTIIFALASSLLLSLTVIPVLASFLLGTGAHHEPWLSRQLSRLYMPTLGLAMRHEKVVVAIAGLLLVAAAGVFGLVGKTFMPTMNEGDLIVQLEKLPSITLDESLALDQRIQSALLEQIPEIRGVVARTGSDELGLDPMGLNQTDSFLVLAPRSEWRFEDREALIDGIREVLNQFPGVGYAFTQPIEMRVSEMLTGVRGDLAVKVLGPDPQQLNRIAGAIVDTLQTLPGARDVYTTRNEGAQYMNITIDRMEAGRLGIDADTLSTLLRTQLEGWPIGHVFDEGRRIPLVIGGTEALRQSPARLEAMQVTLPSGQSVPLTQLARFEITEGHVALTRERGQAYAVAIANVEGRDLVGFVEEAQQTVAQEVDLPSGYRLEWGGEFENQQRASARLALVVPMALGLIFLVLFSTFRSVRQALLVLSNVPFAMIGGIFALAITGEYLSVPASVGFIALLGIAVLNGVVMVTYFNQLRAQGQPMDVVVVEGARRRLRPVLMTASIAALGLVPLLFATGPGSEIQRPLAIVVIGGLASATLLTLILLPILYRRFGSSPAKTEPLPS
ncbi:efflux RND transporter permease subunit [Ectothiorhodospira lacustris]|uniref:efflux RND transporter permease subunit n=1 Tax=Ectothiorhodospira lacustris TaxID=2899127 RepID=UPI001EE882FA|nr:CusA/CzcA family heavy metal efflux RND transporter [Ectothiorhodospira lacustris]MCG5509503.1 CusA/CzcA family heavy metal efflux RND transporter [Ectothiorhodospira lacustris]MCG5521702.1 CusA/CzcA family heavy metal efflux RND transporter [Ectothiorhodospira lacustris]